MVFAFGIGGSKCQQSKGKGKDGIGFMTCSLHPSGGHHWARPKQGKSKPKAAPKKKKGRAAEEEDEDEDEDENADSDGGNDTD